MTEDERDDLIDLLLRRRGVRTMTRRVTCPHGEPACGERFATEQRLLDHFVVWHQVPTQEAYEGVCRVLHSAKKQRDDAIAELGRRDAVVEAATALVDGWHTAAHLISMSPNELSRVEAKLDDLAEAVEALPGRGTT